MSGKNYRCYCFGNYYLSSIQQGIQASHAITNMFVKYQDKNSPYTQALYDWAENDRTMICLIGGNHEDLRQKTIFFGDAETVYNREPQHSAILPWASFKEDEISLNEALTSIAIIAPESLYNMAKTISRRDCKMMMDPISKRYMIEVPGQELTSLTAFELEFLKMLNSSRMAS